MHHDDATTTGQIQLPTPTVWPIVLALGVALLVTALVTSVYIGALGLVLILMGSVGWFRQVLPHEAHEPVPVETEEIRVETARRLLKAAPISDERRKILPIESFRISSGIKGGLAGGFAMTVPAGIFSVVKYHSFWYAVNLMAAGGFVSWAGASNQFLGEFHLRGLLAATAIHGMISILVGLLYVAMLHMFPKYPILSAGFVVPLIFTGLMHTAIGVVSPILNQRIEWFWFVASQIFFGLVCGFVVNLHDKVRTPQFQALPFAVRAGFEMGPGTGAPTDDAAGKKNEEENQA
ncbi:cytochrome c oxidase subunit 4 [Acidicapsa dinghuensis]|uniref:Cytochrome c oxidase subunit 4 n=1 Tax=Acidicapsa dinghuensis TaxID=2218256 RepID=A0ABW1EQ54_9BACT|nr:cytochrome c oxidase subunit 4 [Acidicapsa dinghuensis]